MSARRPGLTVAALTACVGLLSACSQDAPVLDSAATAPLHEHVQTAREAMDDNDGAEARQALDAFRTEVARLSDAGGINPDDAAVLVTYAEQIEAAIPVTSPGRAESSAPKLVTPRQLDDATAPVPIRPDPAPAQPAPPTQQRPATTAPVPQNDEDAVDTREPDAPRPTDPEPNDPEPNDPEPNDPEPNDPEPGDAEPGTEDPGTEDPGSEEPAPEPGNPQPDDPADDTDGTSEGAGE